MRALTGVALLAALSPACGSARPVEAPHAPASDEPAEPKILPKHVCSSVDASATRWTLVRAPPLGASYWWTASDRRLIVEARQELSVFDAESGARLAAVAGSHRETLANGLLVVHSSSATVLLEADSGQIRATLPGAARAISPDGSSYAVEDGNRWVIHQTGTGAERAVIDLGGGSAYAMSWGLPYLTLDWFRESKPTRGVDFYDWNTGAKRGSLPGAVGTTNQLLSPDRKTLALWQFDHLWLLDTSTLRLRARVAFVPNRTRIFHGYMGGALGWANDVVFSPDSAVLAVRHSPPHARVDSITVETQVTLLSVQTGARRVTLPDLFETGAHLSFSPDGATLFTAQPNKRGQRAFSVRTGAPLATPVELPDDRIKELGGVHDPTGARYAIQVRPDPNAPETKATAIEIRTASSDAVLRALGVGPLEVTSIALGTRPIQLAWQARGHVAVWDATGALVSRWPAVPSSRQERPAQLVFSEDGTVLANVGQHAASMRRLDDGQVISEWQGASLGPDYLPGIALQEHLGVRNDGKLFARRALAGEIEREHREEPEIVSLGPGADEAGVVTSPELALSVWHRPSGKRVGHFIERNIHEWGWVDADTLFALVTQPDAADGVPMRWIRFYELGDCSAWSLVPIATASGWSWIALGSDRFEARDQDAPNLLFDRHPPGPEARVSDLFARLGKS